jgi:hypothetical protein
MWITHGDGLIYRLYFLTPLLHDVFPVISYLTVHIDQDNAVF